MILTPAYLGQGPLLAFWVQLPSVGHPKNEKVPPQVYIEFTPSYQEN